MMEVQSSNATERANEAITEAKLLVIEWKVARRAGR
jgi:hypothetical protein